MSGSLFALIGGLVAVAVEGSTTCPTPAAVQERLRPLLPAGGGGPSVVRLHREAAALHISVVRAAGHLLAWRSLDAASNDGGQACEGLAEAAAVIVAAWQSDVGARPLLAEDAPTSGLRLSAGSAPAAT